MAVDFKFPDVGEGIHEGELVRWLVKEGSRVREHEPLVQVETDKAVVELPSPASGVVLKLHKQPGAVVKVGEVLATIGESGERVVEKFSVPVMPDVPKASVADSAVVEKHVFEGGVVLALPAVRVLAKELGVDISGVKGSGAGGMITEKDLRAVVGEKVERKEGVSAKLSFEKFGKVLRIPLRGLRRVIAKNMLSAVQHVAPVTHADFADVTELWVLRQKFKKQAEDQGFGLTFLPFVIKAVTVALKAHPFLNASLDDEKNEIVVKQYFNIGCAVDTTDGLVVPVLKNADHLSIFSIAKQLQTLADKARERSLSLEEMQGGSFTITNIGSIGGTFFTPIINYPECAILGTGRIREEPAVLEGNIVVRKRMPLCLTFDHRIIDGARAARFVNDVIAHLENPSKMLMDAD